VRNIEGSAKYSLTKKTFFELAYYHSWYSNSLVAANIYYDGKQTTQYQPLGKAEIQGLQFSAQTSISIFSFYANATYASPYAVLTSIHKTDSLARMGDIASVSANAGANMKFFREKFNLNVRVNIVGDKPTGQGTTIPGNPFSQTPGYTILNATLGYKINKMALVQFRTDNIFNTAYYSPGIRSASGIQASRVPQPGRVFYIQCNLNLTK
jgi:outer membrane receptor protein involved in Fe transport